MKKPQRSKLPELYGPIENGVWANQAEWMISTSLPIWLQPHWRYKNLLVKTLYCHKILVEPFIDAVSKIQKKGGLDHLTSFDGCFAIRRSRRDVRQSVHSWGLAIDINAADNQLGVKPTIDQVIIDSFQSAGFVWGGDWQVPDGMHFQFVTED